MTEATQTPMVDHIQHFWSAVSEPHVRILVDMRRDHDDGSFHWDSSSFGDDVAKALVGSRASAPCTLDSDNMAREAVANAMAVKRRDLQHMPLERIWGELAEAALAHVPRAAATSAEPVAIPEGFQLVPIRPTQWMMDAGLYQSSADTQWEDVYSMWVDMLRVAETEGMEAEPATGLPATPPSSGNADAVREAFNALSMWCTSARFKIRGRGGFDDQTEREIGIGLVEAEIDRRAAALSSAPVAGEWQDMETARLDGKPFLARYQWLGEHRFMVIRRSLEGPWWIRDGSSQTVGGERDAIQFTDWQALPAGPISRNDRSSPEAKS